MKIHNTKNNIVMFSEQIFALLSIIIVLVDIPKSYCLGEEPPGGYYRSRYDHINVDSVVNSKRLVQHYAACLLNKGPCPPQGAELKRILPEALLTNCARCTEKQKVGAYRTIKRLRKEYPNIWKELMDEYDPVDNYVKLFEETILSKKPYLPSPTTTTTTLAETESTTTSTKVLLSNRFGDVEDNLETSPIITILSTTKLSSTTPLASTTKTTPSPVITTTTIRYSKKTEKPIRTTTNNIYDPLPQLIPSMFFNPPRGVTTNTVSLLPGVRLQVDTPNWLSSIGNRVLRTGTKIGQAVVSTVQAVVGK